MRRIMRSSVSALLVLGLVAGCGKKTMKAPPPPPAPPVQAEPTPQPPPPPPSPPPPPPAPTKVDLSDAFFDFDSYTLRDDARNALTDDGKQLVGATRVSVTVEGHCDERGTNDYNLALGQKRADAAKDFLVSYGVDGARVSTISYGETRPFDLGHDETAWAKNRRAHLVANP